MERVLGRAGTTTSMLGFPVRRHWTLWLVLPWLALFVAADPLAWPLGLTYGLAVVAVVAASVLAHELGHALIAERCGVAVREIVLSPLGGVTRFVASEGGLSTRAALAITLAGPASNGLLVLGLVALAWFTNGATPQQPMALWREWGHVSPNGLLVDALLTNMLLLAMNLMPVRPLDGGQACQLVLAGVTSARRSAALTDAIGIGWALLLAVGGAIMRNGGMMVGAVALLMLAWQSRRACRAGASSEGQERL
jgi:Zn-dependent protease